MNKKHNTTSSQPASQAAVIDSTSTPSPIDPAPNAGVVPQGNVAPSAQMPDADVLLSRGIKGPRNRLYRRLHEQVGISFFDCILRAAADAMLDAIEGRDGQPGTLTRAQIFDAEGALSEIARRYLQESLDAGLSDKGFVKDCELHDDLSQVFDSETLRYYEAERLAQKQYREKAADAMRKKIFKRLQSDGVGQVVMHILYHAAHRIGSDLEDLTPAEEEAKLAALFGSNGLVQDGDKYLIQGFHDAVEIIDACGSLRYLAQVLDYETFMYLISN